MAEELVIDGELNQGLVEMLGNSLFGEQGEGAGERAFTGNLGERAPAAEGSEWFITLETVE